MHSYKIVAICVLLCSSFFSVAVTTYAHDTTPEHAEEHQIQNLMAQISALLKTVEGLQALLTAAQSGTPLQTQFTRNLKVGDRGEDVRALQGMLNDNPRTTIVLMGDGSPGNETTYFGERTARAVSKFQELYYDEILAPAGLARGSGYFGPSTRAKMNALIRARIGMSQNPTGNANTITTTPSYPPFLAIPTGTTPTNTSNQSTSALPSSSILFTQSSDQFAVGRANSYAGAPGENITIDGAKLTNGTKIHFKGTSITGIANGSGTSLTFTIPSVTKGPYELTFTSDTGEKALRIMDFTVTDLNAVAPVIYAVSPSAGPNGSTITIYGTGFTPTNNQVEFGMNAVPGIPSSDGKTLVVTVNPNLELPTASQAEGIPNAEWPVFIYVANSNGRALEPGMFVIRY